MDIRRLKYFVAVAEEGHITRAAERLCMQQPPLSQQIKLLEAELDTQLFRRTPKGVELADAGRTLLEDATRILADVDRAAARVMRTARGELGRIVFGFTHSTAFHTTMLRTLTEFHQAHPRVELSLIEETTGELLEDIRAAELDLAIVRSSVTNRDGLQIHDLEREPMLVAMPSKHHLVRSREGITLEMLAH